MDTPEEFIFLANSEFNLYLCLSLLRKVEGLGPVKP